MSIFGTTYSKFVSGSDTVLLEHSLLDPTMLELEYVEHKSVLNGKRNFITKGNRSEFKVTLFLFKYSNPTTKLNEVLDYEDSLVVFYPFVNGNPIQNEYGSNINFYLSNIELFFLTELAKHDVLVLTFTAQDYSSALIDTSQAGWGVYFGNRYKV